MTTGSPANSAANSAANNSAANNSAANNSAANNAADPMRHFGRQVRKARQSRGWTIRDAGRALGYDDA
jgi:ribosome-binding protein aMBF1 (putative translation factor)